MKNQKGAALVEFALAAGLGLFFVILFGFEFGRALYVWNTVEEVTRRATRVAVVCNRTQENIANRVALFNAINDTNTDSAILSGFNNANIDIRYLKEDITTLATTDTEVYFIEATITNFTHTIIIPLPIFNSAITLPAVTTILPSEALGFGYTASGTISTCPVS